MPRLIVTPRAYRGVKPLLHQFFPDKRKGPRCRGPEMVELIADS